MRTDLERCSSQDVDIEWRRCVALAQMLFTVTTGDCGFDRRSNQHWSLHSHYTRIDTTENESKLSWDSQNAPKCTRLPLNFEHFQGAFPRQSFLVRTTAPFQIYHPIILTLKPLASPCIRSWVLMALVWPFCQWRSMLITCRVTWPASKGPKRPHIWNPRHTNGFRCLAISPFLVSEIEQWQKSPRRLLQTLAIALDRFTHCVLHNINTHCLSATVHLFAVMFC